MFRRFIRPNNNEQKVCHYRQAAETLVAPKSSDHRKEWRPLSRT